MYLTIGIIIAVAAYVFMLISPFIRRFREKLSKPLENSPFESYWLIECYIHGKKLHYEKVEIGDIAINYIMGNAVLGLLLSVVFGLIWPATIFILLISFILKKVLTKIKNKQQK